MIFIRGKLKVPVTGAIDVIFWQKQDEKYFSTCLSPFLNHIACLKRALNKSEEISQFQIDFYPN